MKKLIAVIAISSVIMVGLIARADDKADLDKAITDLDAKAQTNDGRQRVLTAISKETGVPVSTLQAQRSKTGFGFGELLIANSLASATGKTFDEIAALKASSTGWGKIAKENNLKLGDLVSKAHRAGRSDSRDIRDDKRDIREDTRDIRKDRSDTREDTREIKSDRDTLKEAIQSGDKSQIQAEREKLRRDIRERNEDVRDLNRDKRDRRNDMIDLNRDIQERQRNRGFMGGAGSGGGRRR